MCMECGLCIWYLCGVYVMRDVGCMVWYGVCLVCVRMVCVCVNS